MSAIHAIPHTTVQGGRTAHTDECPSCCLPEYTCICDTTPAPPDDWLTRWEKQRDELDA